MKKKKLLALMLSAAMTLTTIVPGATVFAADADAFTDGPAVEAAFTAGETTAEFNELTLKLNPGENGTIYGSKYGATFTVKAGETYSLPKAKANEGYDFYYWDFGGLGMVGGTEVTFDALVNVYRSYNLIKFDGAGNAYVDCTAKYTEVEKPELKEITVIYNLGDHGTYFDQKEVSVTVGNGITHKLPSTADIKADEGWELFFWDFSGLGFQGNTEITFEDLVKYNEEYGFIKYDEKGNASVTCTAQYKEVEKPELKELTVNYDFGEHGTYYGQNVASVTVGNGIAHNLPSNDTEKLEIEDGYELFFWDFGNGFGLKGGEEITLELLTYYNEEYGFVEFDANGNATTTCTAQYKEVACKHTKLDKIPGTPASCTRDGMKDYYGCRKCGKYFADAEGKKELVTDEDYAALVIPAGHTKLDKIPGTPASCTRDGMKDYYGCRKCGKYFADAEGKKELVTDEDYAALVIPAGHTKLDKIPGTPASCTRDGMKDYYGCRKCGKYFADAEGKKELVTDEDYADLVIPAGHTKLDKIPGTPASCTRDGMKDYYGCRKCGKYFADAEGKKELVTDEDYAALVIPAGHTKLDKIPGTPASCTREGVKDYYGCRKCGKYFADAEGKKELVTDEDYAALVIPALDHKMIKTDGWDATCTTPGVKAYYRCEHCNGRFFDEAGKEPVGDKPDYTIPAKGHDMTYTAGWDATCTTDGVKGYYLCNNCHGRFWDEAGEDPVGDKPDYTIPAKGHDMTYTAGWDATCTEKGVKGYYLCNNCHGRFWDEAGEDPVGDKPDYTIPAKGHDMTYTAGWDATCTEKGVKGYYYCKNCHGRFLDEAGEEPVDDNPDYSIPALGHECDDNGNCSRCGEYVPEKDIISPNQPTWEKTFINGVCYVKATFNEPVQCDAGCGWYREGDLTIVREYTKPEGEMISEYWAFADLAGNYCDGVWVNILASEFDEN